MGEVGEDLVKRFRELEKSQAKLREQMEVFLREGGEEKAKRSRRGRERKQQDMVMMAGNFVGNPYRVVLHQLGHALHICRPGSGELIFWNREAEVLYGWKSYEVLGQKLTDLLIDVQSHPYWESIMDRAYCGETWSGQFPFRKRSGELFMALVTANPLSENGVCIGVITVSSDATMLNNPNPDRSRTHLDDVHKQSRVPKMNFKRVHWSPQPQIASSVSNLAGKVLEKLNIRVNANHSLGLERDSATNPAYVSADGSLQNDQQSELPQASDKNAECCPSCYSNVSGCTAVEQTSIDFYRRKGTPSTRYPEAAGDLVSFRNSSTSLEQGCRTQVDNSAMPCNGVNLLEEPLEQATMPRKNTSLEMEDLFPLKLSTSIETTGSSQSGSSTVDDIESNLVADSEIHWEDLVLGEEIGEGSYAVVYRGVWNGSDVAIKVYTGTDYRESILLDYSKEIAIMKKLRHPNVLLFMGAVYSSKHLAIVTEYLPRGSLFKTLHKNNQALDLKRRLRMALDVVRGMNYLHRRNPPIIHRDLKSSNLLVDKNWTVKVGDFGLSCLKLQTVATAKTGRGTPQWMAPEVLRGECSCEKSDVFSFGVILWELMTESIPWSDLNSMQVVGVVGFMDRRLDIPQGTEPRVEAIISDCWASDPLHRPSSQDLVERVAELTEAIAPPPPARRRLVQPQRALPPEF